MPNLVTLDEVKKQLRVTWDDEDSYLNLLALASESAIINYLKYTPTWTTSTVPSDVKLAILVLITTYYEAYRDGGDFTDQIALGYPPAPVSWLLHRYRKPAYA